MAFPVSTRSAGELITAAIWNADLKDNLTTLRAGGVAISGQGANEIPFASSATQLSRSASLTYNGTTFLVASFSASHAFGAGGTGEQRLTVRNSTAGTGNAGVVAVGNDGSAGAAEIYATSTTFTPTSELLADCVSLRSNRVGGLSLAAGHASGVTRIYANGFTQRMQVGAGVTVGDTTDPGSTNFRVAGTSALVGAVTLSSTLTLGGNLIAGSNWISGDGGNEGIRIDASGSVYIGDTSNADIALGLTVNMGANAGTILALKNSNIAHGLGTEETDTFASFVITNSTLGGLAITSYSEASTGAIFRLVTEAASGSGDTTKGTAANGYIDIAAFENGTTVGADENVLVVRSGNTTRFILDADGDSHQDVGTAWTNFDEFDDVALLTTISAGVSRKGDPLRRQFGALLKRNRRALEQARVVTFNADGHHFVNWSRLAMLKVGAIRQLAQQLAETRAELRRLQRQSRMV